MSFVSKTFVFLFLPGSLLLYFLAAFLESRSFFSGFFQRFRVKDWLLILLSIGFYAWSGVIRLSVLILLILILYTAARLIELCRCKHVPDCSEKELDCKDSHTDASRQKLLLSAAVTLIILFLIICKYPAQSSSLLNAISGKDDADISIIIPVGISFISFSAISYLADIYRGHAASGNLTDCAFYILFFPKIISGPIVLWKDFQPQLGSRHCSEQLSVTGVNRIIIGLAKKAIIADILAAYLKDIGYWDIDRISALLSILIYTLQIYYDFSGYSDIAIGISNLFGFDFKANFNFPYRSLSISEFWRRWHISLGTWFREYVYFPLGGSRCSKVRMVMNLGIVFLLTGIWHGVSLNFLLWGVINGFFVICEHFLMGTEFYKKIPSFIKYGCTMLIIMVCWQLFRSPDMLNTVVLFVSLLGRMPYQHIVYTWEYYLDNRLIFLLVIGYLGATVLGSPKIASIYRKWSQNTVFFVLQEVCLIGLLILSLLFIVSSTYSPFIYFQF